MSSSLIQSLIKSTEKILDGLGHMVTATLESTAGVNKNGEPTYSAGVQHKCIYEQHDKLLRTEEGKEVRSVHKLTFVKTVTIKVGDRITIPGQTGRPVLAVMAPTDKTPSPYIVEVFL